jgi:hypothetical protein
LQQEIERLQNLLTQQKKQFELDKLSLENCIKEAKNEREQAVQNAKYLAQALEAQQQSNKFQWQFQEDTNRLRKAHMDSQRDEIQFWTHLLKISGTVVLAGVTWYATKGHKLIKPG